MSKIDEAIERCVEALDAESIPSKMSIQEAIDFWEGIAAEVEGRIDALNVDRDNSAVEE